VLSSYEILKSLCMRTSERKETLPFPSDLIYARRKEAIAPFPSRLRKKIQMKPAAPSAFIKGFQTHLSVFLSSTSPFSIRWTEQEMQGS
jgi:hypothetical protein